MSTDEYYVCRINHKLYKELTFNDNCDILEFLNRHTNILIWTSLKDQFTIFENAKYFADMMYKDSCTGDIIGIYNSLDDVWMYYIVK